MLTTNDNKLFVIIWQFSHLRHSSITTPVRKPSSMTSTQSRWVVLAYFERKWTLCILSDIDWILSGHCVQTEFMVQTLRKKYAFQMMDVHLFSLIDFERTAPQTQQKMPATESETRRHFGMLHVCAISYTECFDRYFRHFRRRDDTFTNDAATPSQPSMRT